MVNFQMLKDCLYYLENISIVVNSCVCYKSYFAISLCKHVIFIMQTFILFHLCKICHSLTLVILLVCKFHHFRVSRGQLNHGKMQVSLSINAVTDMVFSSMYSFISAFSIIYLSVFVLRKCSYYLHYYFFRVPMPPKNPKISVKKGAILDNP